MLNSRHLLWTETRNYLSHLRTMVSFRMIWSLMAIIGSTMGRMWVCISMKLTVCLRLHGQNR